MKKFLGLVLACLCSARLPAATTPGVETQTAYLSGHGSDDAVPWNFYCNDGRRAGTWTTIKVPSCWEQEGFGTYNYGYEFRATGAENSPGFARETGMYYHDFTVPAGWQGRTVRIVFEGSMTDTEVKINGQSAGPMHQGSFYRFKYDITPLLKFGASNRLEVTVHKTSANASVNRAERQGDYWNFGGIFRPVYLEALPPQFIDWTAIDAKADGTFAAQVHLGASATAPTTVTAQIFDAKDQPVGAPISVEVAPGQDTAVLRATEAGVKLWTAETPNLYHVRFTLAANGQAGHTVADKFGFRTFEVRANDGLYLNGQKIVLKGVNRHSFSPETGRTLNAKICYDDVRLIKEANMNAVRMSHYPPDHEFLEACDELGLYVLDELGGWHGAYDTPTGQVLIGEMVRRDVNHPSILFWDNGNEGGWNAANDGEFAKWDPQVRTVVHPWARLGVLNTQHYPTYDTVKQDSANKEVFMFTEVLHGLYDGGGAVGLYDFWQVLHQAPSFGGMFIWALLDEGVVRTDMNGKVDARGNLAPDGIVGPHREKEGSFYTIRQIWSPVQLGEPTGKDGAFTIPVENNFDFTNLKDCTFTWEAGLLNRPEDAKAGHRVGQSGTLASPDVAPHASGTLSLPVPAASNGWGDVLYITAKDPAGRVLWTWSYPSTVVGAYRSGNLAFNEKPAAVRDEAEQLIVSSSAAELRFDKKTGLLAGVSVGGKPLSLANGPHFLAYHHERGTGAGVGGGSPATVFKELAGPGQLTSLATHTDQGNNVVVETKYDGPLKSATWTIDTHGNARLDYTYAFTGEVDLLGVNFDYPESQVKAITWEGYGPYRVWQNRMEGGTFDDWHNSYSDAIPGEVWTYPEFKGYFRGWRWAALETSEGTITVRNLEPLGSFLGIYSPRDGTVGPLLDLPKTGLSFLDVIPSMRDKGKQQEQLGPQGTTKTVSGETSRSVSFTFKVQ